MVALLNEDRGATVGSAPIHEIRMHNNLQKAATPMVAAAKARTCSESMSLTIMVSEAPRWREFHHKPLGAGTSCRSLATNLWYLG
jgi:hypothetical protein